VTSTSPAPISPAGARAAGRRVAVIEDEESIAAAIATRLRSEGYEVEIAGDGPGGVKLCDRFRPDAVVLDLMLPGLDGIEVCKQIQRDRPVPVLMLTARDTETDLLVGLAVGADDYMTKPFSIEELLARITATLRRTRPAAPTEQQAPPVIVVGDIVIDLALQQVRRNGQPVHLTPTEFALLRELAVNRGKLLTHAHLLRRVWGHGYETETEYLRVYVRRLRAKLEAEESAPLILTQPLSQTVAVGDTVNFTVTIDGAAPLSYQWTKNGAAIPGATAGLDGVGVGRWAGGPATDLAAGPGATSYWPLSSLVSSEYGSGSVLSQ